MLVPQQKPPQKQLDPQAELISRQYVRDFANVLLLHAKLIAYRANADKVEIAHVDEALEIINKSRKQNWLKEIALMVGSALFGAFIQGFITEISNGNIVLIAIYVTLGFIGVFLAFWGLRK